MGDLERRFANPPLEYATRPLWFWNGKLDTAQTDAIMAGCKRSGYYGFGILPAQHMSPGFMTAEFLNHYKHAVDKASELGLKMCLYDEYWFPSGSAGGQLAEVYPDALSKRLDMDAVDIDGPGKIARSIPAGELMAAVGMRLDSMERIDLTAQVKNGKLLWDVPQGKWKVMIFTCVVDGARGLVDYLDPKAVEKFIMLTYQKYHETFGEHFGRTIDSAFFDEPTFHWVQGGRAWTPAFNGRFRRKYGYSPAEYYPALWYDIGDDTAAARNALLGFRAELYAEGFPKVLNDWCREHKIELTGHQDQEEIVNPVGLCGDLIKCFKYQDIPAIDQVFQYGRGSRAYKVVSSAAYNYDKRLVVTECYGGISKMPTENLYKEAMDQFAKGINFMVPHAVWYDTEKVIFEPELSYRSDVYGRELPRYNQYVARLQMILQHGRHVADIAVLYPIAALQAGYYFGVGKPYEGGVIPPEADYMDIGEMLALSIRRDFTFLHPEVLDERCSVEGAEIRLNNTNNHECYKVLIIPGGSTISLSNLQRIREFYEIGGKVIATTKLPCCSAEFGKNAEVKAIVAEMFEGESAGDKPPYRRGVNPKGGRAYFAPKCDAATLKVMLDDAMGVYDVEFESEPEAPGGNLSYIHKVLDGRHFYFLANSSDTPVDSWIRLRGRMGLQLWDPHTGEIRGVETEYLSDSGSDVTRVRLLLPPIRSIFLVSAR